MKLKPSETTQQHERAYLASLLQLTDAAATTKLELHHFDDDAHGKMFEALVDLHNSGMGVDQTVLAIELSARNIGLSINDIHEMIND